LRRKGALVALVALVALGALGTFLMYAVGASLLGGGFPSLFAPFMLAGAFCLVGASYYGIVLVRVDEATSWKKLRMVTWLGILFTIVAVFFPFPVGCNLQSWYNTSNISHGCPADPVGTWSSAWPNVLLLEIGLVFASVGLASAKPDRSKVVGVGMGLIMGGLVLIALGSSFSYMTSCPANGCPPLTSAGWWSLFWPNVLAEAIGAGQIGVGSAACLITLLRQRVALSPVVTPVSGGPPAEAQ
jgi:hypothetical protein